MWAALRGVAWLIGLFPRIWDAIAARLHDRAVRKQVVHEAEMATQVRQADAFADEAKVDVETIKKEADAQTSTPRDRQLELMRRLGRRKL